MNFADLNVRYPGSLARWHKSSGSDGDHFMVLLRKDLPRPTLYATADKNKARKADSRTRYQARKTKRHAEGEEDRPRRASRHLNGFSLAAICFVVIHHTSPSDQVHDCKDHDPHPIYEVPIKSNHAKAFTVSRIDPTEQGEDQSRG